MLRLRGINRSSLASAIVISLLAQVAVAQPADSLTAIDVLLLPDQTMVEHAQRDNARLRETYPAGFALDSTHRPHITLLQRYVRTKDLASVYAAVEQVFNRERPAGWELTATGYYYLDFNNMGLAGIVIRPTPELRRLQQEIIDAVAPFTEPKGTSAAYVTMRDSPSVNEPTLQYVENFIPQRNGNNFNPHVTIGVGQLDFVQKMKAAPFDDFKFQVAGAAVFHLGNFGAAAKELWRWNVPVAADGGASDRLRMPGSGQPLAHNRFELGRCHASMTGHNQADRGHFAVAERRLIGRPVVTAPQLGLILRPTDAEREYAYDRNSEVGRLARALDEAPERGWTVVDMMQDWKMIFPED